MRAGQESYRDSYEPVRKVSQQYRGAMAKLDSRTAVWQLMNLLAKYPAVAVVGKCHCDRQVHFGKKMDWSVRGKSVRTHTVPEKCVSSAVLRLRKILGENGIMYGVWSSNPMGNKKHGTAVKVGQFTVGLVRVDKREKISRYKGDRAEPGS